MEKSKSGAPIYRYNESEQKSFEGPSGEPSTEEISAHIEKYVGKIDMVLHELVSEEVHIDIHWVKPAESRPFHTLITSGMSDKPMHTPEGVKNCEYAELCFCLPEDWELSQEAFTDEEHYWPVRWLKLLARFPHAYNTWLCYGHTIPNGDPAMPLSGDTNLNTMLLLPPVVFDDEFRTLRLKNKSIDFYSLIPLYQEEVDLKLRKGVEALFDGFDKYGVNDILDLNRPNTAQRKKRFGFF